MKTPDLDKNFTFVASAFYRLVNKIATQEMTFTGLTPSYAFLIVAVKKSPGIRITELSQKLYLDTSTVTRLIEKLEVKNYVIRDSLPGITQVYLTDLGNQVYSNVVIAIDHYQNQFKSTLGKKFTKELNRSLSVAMEKIKEIPVEE